MHYDRSIAPHPAASRSVADNNSRKAIAFRAPGFTSQLKKTSPATPVIQRVKLDIGELNTDNWEGVQAYALANLRNGRDDLIHILKMRVKGKDPERLPDLMQYLTEQAGEHAEAPKKAVPANIHMIWMGGRISDHACANIIDAHSKLARGFTLTLWTDKKKSAFLEASPGTKLVDLKRTHGDTFDIRDVHGLIDERVKKTYALALERDAYSMASDLARYSVLLKQGGIYMDVDIKMGSVDPSAWNMQMSEHGLPVLGANIRDKRSRDQMLPKGLGELTGEGDLVAAGELQNALVPFVTSSFNKMFGNEPRRPGDERATPETIMQHDTLDQATKTKLTAKTQYMSGNVANQFIAAPPAHKFIDFLIKEIGESLEDKDGWEKNQVAALTGPQKFGSVISAYYGTKYGVKNIEARERRHTMDPHWLAQVVDINWLTEESENQEMQVAPVAKSYFSPWMAALVLGAVVIIGATIVSRSNKK